MASVTLVLVILSFISQVKPARILVVIPTPSVSHQVVFRPITQELARRGHDVVVITTDPAFPKGEAPANLTEIDVKVKSYEKWQELLVDIFSHDNSIQSQMKAVYTAVAKVFEVQMDNEEVKDIIAKKRGEFDLLLTEACARPALAFSHVYKVPLIQMSSFGAVAYNDDYVGASTHPLLFPTPWHAKTYNLTMWDKVVKLWNHWDFKSFFNNDLEKEEDRILKAGFGNIPPLSELKKNVAMLFLNVHPLWTDNQPVPPNVVYLWGLHKKPKKELPKELESYLNSSKKGVIYFSLGSNVIPSLLPSNTIHVLLTVLSQMPYDVLMKWDTEDLPIQSHNIRVATWLPQADLLRHPNLKLFITQGGLQSTDEAIEAGVPLIGIPLLGDQWYNVEKYVHHKIGVRLDIDTLTAEKFKSGIETVISDQRYRENIVKLRDLTHDQPQTPLERAMWWIDHVLRHGAAHLRSPAANMPLRQYLELDLAAVVLSTALTALAVLMIALYTLWRCFSEKLVVNTKHKRS